MIGAKERLDDPDQLRCEIFLASRKTVAELGKSLPRCLEDDPLETEAVGQLLEIDGSHLAQVSRAAKCGSQLRADWRAGRIEHERRHLGPVHGQLRSHNRFNPQDVWPAKFQMSAVGHDFDLGGRLWRRRSLPGLACFRDGKRHTENIDVFR